jgi:hypothetical protein
MRPKQALRPLLLALLASQSALADLAAPTIQSAAYDESNAPLITIEASDTNSLPGKQYHAVLLTALTPSLRHANLLGGAGDGSMLSATSDNDHFGIAVNTSSRERYYAAVAVHTFCRNKSICKYNINKYGRAQAALKLAGKVTIL